MNSRRRQAIEGGAGGAPLSERNYRQAARSAVRRALREDLAGYGDLTGSVFTGNGVAAVMAREAGVLSGVAALEETAHQVDPALAVEVFIHDGERFAAGDAVAELRGPLAAILAAERTALNFLCRLSGIATLTATYVAETAGTRARIAATRKTTPGLRALEKQAVVHGGGTPHRFGLFDGAMIKDNHVAAAGSVRAAIAAVRSLNPSITLEVEVDTLDQLDEALDAGAQVVLLDNFDTADTAEAVRRARRHPQPVELEASGGLTLERAAEVAATGVDYLAVGALTHSAPALDLGLDLTSTVA